jgi:hypothetical protein
MVADQCSSLLKVEINSRSSEVWDWKKQIREFAVLPRTGEFLHMASYQNWFRVENVVHRDPSMGTEIVLYAVDSGMAMDFFDDAS